MQEPFYRSRPSVVGWLLVGQTLTGYLKVAGRVLAPYDVSPVQALALGIISQHDAAITPGQLAQRLGQETQSITGLIDRLEGRGWIVRQRTSADRRKVLLRLSDEGRRLLGVLLPIMYQACDDAMSSLEPAELQELIRLLRKTSAGIRDRLDHDASLPEAETANVS
jgi:DNA-binding MarR family transcriptional regulator